MYFTILIRNYVMSQNSHVCSQIESFTKNQFDLKFNVSLFRQAILASKIQQLESFSCTSGIRDSPYDNWPKVPIT